MYYKGIRVHASIQGELHMILRSTANKTEQLVMTALMTSLVLIGTMLIRVPIPMTQGYVHMGDAMIYIGVLLLGKKHGTAAASLGSLMADILSGYAFWAPWSLVIKAAMAYTAGVFAERALLTPHHAAHHSVNMTRAMTVLGMVLGGLLMTAGYFLAEGIMYGNWPAAMLGVPWNIGQFTAGISVALTVAAAVSRIHRS